MQDPADAPFIVELTWGEALRLQTSQSRVPGGLKRAHNAITAVFGTSLGTRPVFQELFDVDKAGDLSDDQVQRAWALLVAVGHDPADPYWRLPAEAAIFPRAMGSPVELREMLTEAMRQEQARYRHPVRHRHHGTSTDAVTIEYLSHCAA